MQGRSLGTRLVHQVKLVSWARESLARETKVKQAQLALMQVQHFNIGMTNSCYNLMSVARNTVLLTRRKLFLAVYLAEELISPQGTEPGYPGDLL